MQRLAGVTFVALTSRTAGAMDGAVMRADIRKSFVACRSATRHHAKSFYFSSFALPAGKRDAAYAVYAFCRYVDDLVDEAGSVPEAHAAVAELLDRLDLILDGGARNLDFGAAFAWTVQHFGIERDLFRDLVKGVEMDLSSVRIPDPETLREYCYYVAGVVGLMMCRIFGLKGAEGRNEAVEMGIAMQLTNIARDVGEDIARDRIYLPATTLEHFGVTEIDLRAGVPTPGFCELIRSLIAEARAAYRKAQPAIRLLDDDGSQLTVRVMGRVYGGILDEIENNRFHVLRRRASTSFFRKCGLAWLAWNEQRIARRVP